MVGVDQSDRYEELWESVRRVPPGRVASYGAIGRMLRHPTTGRIVGRMLAQTPSGEDVPWWRIVAASGMLPIGKLDPMLQRTQADLLSTEGVELKEGRVPRRYFVDDELG